MSRRFQKRAQQALEEFEGRSLKEDNFLALWIDGKHVAGEQMIICMGVTEAGYKKVLGFTQATTERHEPIVELLRDLLDRGLSFEEGMLCVVDGGRGLRKAIREVFGKRAEIQRCQWHKRENVVSYLPKADQKKMAEEAPVGLPGADLRGRQRAAHRSPCRVGADQPEGGQLPHGRIGRDAHSPPSWPIRRAGTKPEND